MAKFCRKLVLLGLFGLGLGCGTTEPPANPDLPKEVNVPPAPKGGSKMKVMQDPNKR